MRKENSSNSEGYHFDENKFSMIFDTAKKIIYIGAGKSDCIHYRFYNLAIKKSVQAWQDAVGSAVEADGEARNSAVMIRLVHSVQRQTAGTGTGFPVYWQTTWLFALSCQTKWLLEQMEMCRFWERF